jgi:dATP pyrophosphohydrolase
MARAPFQVLVFPYRIQPNDVTLYAVFRRADSDHWQGIAGGGEDDESPLDAARREAHEEAEIKKDSQYLPLKSCANIPVEKICGFLWGDDVNSIPEYCFGVEATNENLKISSEHAEYRWLSYKEADRLLQWGSNKTALRELETRMRRQNT